MSKSRSPAKRQSGASGSGSQASEGVVPTGVLPASLARAQVNNDAVELITSVFVLCYPDVKDIGELDKSDRATWIRIREGLLEGNKAAIEALKIAVKIINKQVEAEIEDMQVRRVETLKDQVARRRRKDRAHAQRIKERETKLGNDSLREKLLIGMTAVSFICTIGFVVASFFADKAFAYGSGGAFSLIWLVGILRLFVFGKHKDSP